MNNEKEIRDIVLDDIIPNRFQPREVFNEESLNELSSSIKEHGVIQPIVVRQVGDKYEIIAGERRYKASQLAGKTTIPCIVRELDDIQSSKVALLENLQRKDLTPIEEARTYQTILKIGGMKQEDLALSIGKSQSAIANKLRLLALDLDVQNALLAEQISERHARSLLNITDKNQQKKLLATVVQNRMTVKELDDEVAKIVGNKNVNNVFVEPKEEKPTISNGVITPIKEEPQVVPVTSNIDVTAEQIKKEAVDINPQNSFTNLNDLLKTAPAPEEIKPQNTNMFIPNMPVVEPTTQVPPVSEKVNSLVSPDDNNEIKPLEPDTTETLEVIGEKPIINSTSSTNPIPATMINNMYQQTEPNQPHDLRFAINNIRQAAQATEKFGFVIDTEEFDFENMYQIVIKIDKNK